MDFDLSPEQVALADSARSALAHRWSADEVRKALDHPPATISDDLWNEMAELGWIGIAAPEEVGGSAGDVLTACVLAIEAGRALLPSSLASVIVAAIALDRSQDDGLRLSLLPSVLDGKKRVICAIEEPGGTWGPDAVALVAAQSGDDWLLDGVKILVPDTERTDLLLVAARTPLGLGLVAVPTSTPGVTITPMRHLDAQSIAEVRLENVRVASGSLLGGTTSESLLREIYDIWTVLGAADLLGVSEATLSMTTTYAAERVQFGRPIGSFQAVAHRLADVVVDTEIARSLLYGACLAIDEGRTNSAMLVSAAKAWASDAAVAATECALKLHGGLGFAWEVDVHLYLRRARAGAVTLGDADYHRDRIASLLAESATAGDSP